MRFSFVKRPRPRGVPILAWMGTRRAEGETKLRRIGAVLAGVSMVLALTASTTLALTPPGTLDQHQEIITGNLATWSDAAMGGLGGWALGQTFTPSVTGTLDAVGVYVSATTPPTGPAVQVHPAVVGNAKIQVWSTDLSGLPVGPLLATESPTLSASPGWEYFVLPSPSNIVTGTRYAIVMFTNDPYILNWAGDCSNSYPGGQALVFSVPNWFPITGGPAYCQQDFAFRTYVTAAPAETPPPT